MKVFAKLGWFIKKERKNYIIGILILLIVALIDLLPPQIIGRVIDGITFNSLTGKTLLIYVIILFFAAVLTYAFRYFWRIMIFGASMRLGKILRSRLYHKYTSMSPSFFQERRTGDLMAHATNDIRAVQNTAGGGVLTIADSLMSGGAVLITMAITVDWRLTLIVMIPLPIMIILTSYYGKLLNRGFKKAQAAFSQLNDKTQESIAGIKVTKTFGYEKNDQADFKSLSDDVVNKNLKVSKIDALFDPTIMAVIGVSYFLAIFFGARMVINDDITIGQLVTFTTYLGMMVWPLLALGLFFNIVQRGHASYERINEIINVKNEVNTEVETHNIPEGDIQFNLKNFSFPNDESIALSNVQFTISKGSTIGIVGRTGSGKSALIRLLLREFDTERANEIKYGDQPLRHFDISSLRAQFGYVPQDHFLFSTSIRNNIAFSDPSLENEIIYNASKTSYIHEDILSFPEGYDTVVGERGVSLSGGQKQRISIARALIMNPPVLILDDSLSAVDAETEEHILENMQSVRQGKTNIITAHRMSAVSHADMIVVMDEGTIIERGTHQELMSIKGWYYETYQAQALHEEIASSLDELAKGDDSNGTKS
ncbi:ABC transporter transmembrane domain-containing protein [Mammaliicoccus fleurettii]|uniref:ABC transporter ATP-binding protein n=1 Tax=Mammaliicoccus TaxID=2803850 RepID=UPI001EFA9199|nr:MULTISPECIES: ABC transporter transmembrane domain-containing protein [Mammaliicoccus]MEB6201806.1 ABC transporter transmembrane domain-containing protein [Mammaliicoccus fleurettii]